jgi:polar amino acid transport system substrate-binding protein
MKRLPSLIVAVVFVLLTFGSVGEGAAQALADAQVARQLAPTGKLRVGILMLTYFASEEAGQLKGWAPELGAELARRLGVPLEFVHIENPADMIEAFRGGRVDVAFIGITKDRAAVFDFGPVMIGLRTTFLVPAASTIKSIPEVDQPGVRIVVPARSAQGEHLDKIITKASLIRVPVETPQPAVDMLVAGTADVFSHAVPMLVTARTSLPGSRILPGSYYNVPIAIGYAKGQAATVVEFCKNFVADVKASGFLQKSLDRMGGKSEGVVVLTQ